MKKKLFLPFLLITVFSSAFAQNAPGKSSLPKQINEEGSEQSRKKNAPVSNSSKEQRAKRQIQEMKNGVLLVRLRTQQNALDILQKKDKTKAEELKQSQATTNLQLANAFRQHFTFCPVYFFYSSDSEKIEKGEMLGILLNEKLEKDTTLQLPEKPFFIAEITDIVQDQAGKREPDASYNAEATFKALVLRDNYFNQLTSPFPFYVKVQLLMPPRKRTETELVQILNKDLQNFHKLVTGSTGSPK